MLSIEFLMLLILLLVIKTINASTLPSMALNEMPHVNKCEQITITSCPELKYNQTTVSSYSHGHHMDIDDANEMVRGFFCSLVEAPTRKLKPTRHICAHGDY